VPLLKIKTVNADPDPRKVHCAFFQLLLNTLACSHNKRILIIRLKN
jgi:hypothetical protein